MQWFGVSAIVAVMFEDELEQTKFPSWENIYLVSASSKAEAIKLATERAKLAETSPAEKFTFEDRPARLQFAGIRKIIECTPDDSVESGMEVSYSFLVAKTTDDFVALCRGDAVDVRYEE